MTTDPPQRLEGPHEDGIDVSHGPAHGIMLGMAIGLAFWFCVILLAMVIA